MARDDTDQHKIDVDVALWPSPRSGVDRADPQDPGGVVAPVLKVRKEVRSTPLGPRVRPELGAVVTTPWPRTARVI